MRQCTKEDFKLVLDSYLCIVPDEPKVPGLIPSALNHCAVATNTLIFQIKLAQREGLTTGWISPISLGENTMRRRRNVG